MSSDIKAVTYESAIAVTASDTTDDPNGPFAGLYVGGQTGAQTLKVTTLRGTTVTFASPALGTVIPIAVRRVWSTGTTVTNVLGLLAVPYKGTGV